MTVPGAVAAWTLLSERFGRFQLADTLSPAIQIADEEFPVAEITAEEKALVQDWTRAASL